MLFVQTFHVFPYTICPKPGMFITCNQHRDEAGTRFIGKHFPKCVLKYADRCSSPWMGSLVPIAWSTHNEDGE